MIFPYPYSVPILNLSSQKTFFLGALKDEEEKRFCCNFNILEVMEACIFLFLTLLQIKALELVVPFKILK